ncbi:hypothetical protein OIU76_013890 [Salix suchowensis]|nr:hypothetical protein OIU76_013890 [Salix suchowensis]
MGLSARPSGERDLCLLILHFTTPLASICCRDGCLTFSNSRLILYNLTVNRKPHISMISISIPSSAIVVAATVLHSEVAKSSSQISRCRP